MGTFLGYRCSICGVEYSPDAVTYTCPDDGGNLDILLDYKRIQEEINPSDVMNSTDGSIWRYLPLLPVEYPGHLNSPLRPSSFNHRLDKPRSSANLVGAKNGVQPTARKGELR